MQNNEVLDLYNMARVSHEVLLKAVSTISEDKGDWKPAPQASSPLEILRHLCEWESYFISIAEHGDARDQIAMTLQSHPKLEAVIAELDHLRQHTLEFIEGLSPNDLAKKRTFMEQEATIHGLLVRLLRHEHYHVGQINYLHFLLGLNPEQKPLPRPPGRERSH